MQNTTFLNCYLTPLVTIIVSYDIINFFAESHCRKIRILYTVFEITVSKISGKPLPNNLLNVVKMYLNLMSMYVVTIYITPSFNRLAKDFRPTRMLYLQYVFAIRSKFYDKSISKGFFWKIGSCSFTIIQNDNVDDNGTIKSTSRLTL